MAEGHVPEIAPQLYNESVFGYYGELGSKEWGVRFLQTALPIGHLEKLTLVADIPDSERWPVRELFQRDVDIERVTSELIPYFKDQHKIKFFNPLTIVLLPMSADGRILHGVPEFQAIDPEFVRGQTTRCFEAERYYRIKSPELQPQFSLLEWSSNNVKLVAVDGQHRLSALKRLYREWVRDPSEPALTTLDFMKWTVPIVLLVLRSTSKTADDRLLAGMRDIFVTINKEAKAPTRSRTILLNDQSVTAVCCQELLDYCHRTATAEVPLLFFDWRAHKEILRPEHPAAFLRVEELEDLHINYLIGHDDDEQEQFSNLFVKDMDEPLSPDDPVKKMEQLRKRYRDVLMPAVLHVFATFRPIARYVDFLRKLPESCDTDIKKHALSELMFGAHHGPSALERHIRSEVGNLETLAEQRKSEVPVLFRELIGCRGLFSGFQGFVGSYNEAKRTILSWPDGAKIYTSFMNKALDAKLFDQDRGLLTHICFDPTRADGIVNYRLGDQDRALGAYCALIACCYSNPRAKFLPEIEQWLDTLQATLLKGYKREVRPRIKEESPDMPPAKLSEKVTAEALKRTTKHLKNIKQALELDG